MSHDELSGMAAGYALSALDPEDLEIFGDHLVSCRECQASVGARLAVLMQVDGEGAAD